MKLDGKQAILKIAGRTRLGQPAAAGNGDSLWRNAKRPAKSVQVDQHARRPPAICVESLRESFGPARRRRSRRMFPRRGLAGRGAGPSERAGCSQIDQDHRAAPGMKAGGWQMLMPGATGKPAGYRSAECSSRQFRSASWRVCSGFGSFGTERLVAVGVGVHRWNAGRSMPCLVPLERPRDRYRQLPDA